MPSDGSGSVPANTDLPIQEATLELIRNALVHSLSALPGVRAYRRSMDDLAHGHTWRLLRGGSWNNNPRNCRSAYRNHNQPDNANNNVGFRVVCLPQHPSSTEPLEGIPAGDQEGSRPAPVIGRLRPLIRTAPEGAPSAHGSAIGAGTVPFFSLQP